MALLSKEHTQKQRHEAPADSSRRPPPFQQQKQKQQQQQQKQQQQLQQPPQRQQDADISCNKNSSSGGMAGMTLEEQHAERIERIYEVMDFFLFSIRPDNTYKGTLSFHFHTPSSLPSSSSSSSLDEKQQQQQQQRHYYHHHHPEEEHQQPASIYSTPPRRGRRREEGGKGGREGGPLVLTVRVHGDARAPTIFNGLPEDGAITAHVYCSLEDFLYIYSGQATIRDAMALGIKGKIKVSNFNLRECGRFAAAFDLRSEKWEAFYHAREGEREGGREGTIECRGREDLGGMLKRHLSSSSLPSSLPPSPATLSSSSSSLPPSLSSSNFLTGEWAGLSALDSRHSLLLHAPSTPSTFPPSLPSSLLTVLHQTSHERVLLMQKGKNQDLHNYLPWREGERREGQTHSHKSTFLGGREGGGEEVASAIAASLRRTLVKRKEMWWEGRRREGGREGWVCEMDFSDWWNHSASMGGVREGGKERLREGMSEGRSRGITPGGSRR